MLLLITFLWVGILIPFTSAQVLTTKCPNDDWTKYKERCYMYVGFQHSWSRANTYCQKYGARLVEPTGYVIQDEVMTQVSNRMPNAHSIWTGYYRPDNSQPSYVGEWSDGRSTFVHVGQWGPRQPDIHAGQCAYVTTGGDMKWYMGSCDRVRHFVCEMDPCPGGIRDTYMCNGKCLGRGVLCNGIDDCGNNQDEQNCNTVSGRDCTIEQEGASGQISPSLTSEGMYEPSTSCSWLLKTSPGNRIVLKFTEFRTEANTDVVELFDGGLTSSTSEVSDRLSGSLSDYTFISSYNFMTVRFTTDSSVQYSGFQASWTTSLACGYSQIVDYTYLNTDIKYRELELSSRQNTDECKQECDDDSTCVGFRFDSVARTCFFLNRLPVLETSPGSQLWIQNCYGDTTVQGAVPLSPFEHIVTTSPKQLATPLYPYPYVGNLELEYTLISSANKFITLEVLTIELCCGDYIYIYDADYDLLHTLTSDSDVTTIISTGNKMHVKMDLHKHWKCNGVLMEYRQDCRISMTGSGTLWSPGYGTPKSYPDLMNCEWTLYAPSNDRSITVKFDDFDLGHMDNLTVTDWAGTTSTASLYTGSSLHEQSITSESYVKINMLTSSRYNSRGFMASFSPGCPVLNDDGYALSSQSFDFGDQVTVSCAEGYSFGVGHGTFIHLSCLSGGHWNVSNIPTCSRGQCSQTPFITNGYIVSSDGVLGGHVTKYACKTGYNLLGSASIKCLTNNSWEQAPTCSSTLCQTIANVAPDVNSHVLLGDGLNYGSVLNLTCDNEEEIIGAPIVQCKNGLWDFILEDSQTYCDPIPCEIPVIDHATLSPDPEYYRGQRLNVTCIEGYNLQGDGSFRCGTNDTVPSCIIQECSLDNSDHVIAVGTSAPYNYGDTVNVTCEYSYYLTNVMTSQMKITCLHTGGWSKTPECGKKNCGEVYQVAGSVYVPNQLDSDFCYEYNCSFEFQCEDNFVLNGNSTSGDNKVTCGHVFDGLWDFGDLRCEGGQCPDPGYPASGFLIGESFQKDAMVTFGCSQPGYKPLNSSSEISEGMTCRYNVTSKKMEWVGEMPVCKDTENPTIYSCGNGEVTYRAKMLTPLTVPKPLATDNTAVKEWEIYPENADLNLPFSEATQITYIARDFNDNSQSCRVLVIIPDSMDCLNQLSTQIELSADTTIDVENSIYFEKKNQIAQFVFEPESVNVNANASALNTIHEVEVTAKDSSNVILDKCTLHFRFQAPSCATWAFDIPNGYKSCTGISCTVFCNNNAYFMEAPGNNSTTMSCNGNIWSREPPVCAAATSGYVIYTARYDFKYNIQGGVSNVTACETLYMPGIQSSLLNFGTKMKAECNENSINAVSVTLLQEKTSLQFILATSRLEVHFEFKLTAQDESLTNAFSVKDQCANRITSNLNLETNIEDIRNLPSTSDNTVTCNSGVYDLSSSPPSFQYECQGNRRFTNQGGQLLCLECPKGYYYHYDNTLSKHDCLECPSGTYGTQTADGMTCVSCSNGKNTGLTAQTDVSVCDFKDACPPGYFSFDGLTPCQLCPKNYYSTDSYSRTCRECDGDKVTYETGSTSRDDCKTLKEANEDNATTPCYPNPCVNGNCSFSRLNFLCTCPPGFTGELCETPFNGCTSQPCKNNRRCIASDNGIDFSCSCGTSESTPNEFSGVLCENDDFGCSQSYCKNNGTCHNQYQSYSCKCPTYSGYQNADGTCSTKINPCTVDPCVQGTCYNNSHYYKTCDCYQGYTGINCDTNIDDCIPNMCENGGSCIDGINTFTCSCAVGFHGNYCQFRKACDKKCESEDEHFCNTCNDGTTDTCINVNNDFMCQCKEGYTGRLCMIGTSICKSYPCQHGGNCTAINATAFSCACQEPWTGALCDQLPNLCPNGDACFNGGTCYSTPSGNRCRCPNNFIGDDCSTHYDVCARADPCSGSNSNCSFENGAFSCECQTGFIGDFCETVLPRCSDNVCKNGAMCTDTSSGVTCSCVEGFTGENCDTEVDNCSPDPCGTNRECKHNEAGGYTCVCASGYSGESCDKNVDVNSFDYVITPRPLCRTEASLGMFGDGETDINSLSVSFWVRYKTLHGDGIIMNIFGSRTGGMMIPSSPDVKLTFYTDRLLVTEADSSVTRRKRQTRTFDYANSVADGYWHNIVIIWSAVSQEIFLYIDGEYADSGFFSRNLPAGNVGFLVFGDFDEQTGFTVPGDSFEGLVNRLYVVKSNLTDYIPRLYSRSYTPPRNEFIMDQERTTLLLYSVNYNSELSGNSNRCLPSDQNCIGINERASTPTVTSCPGDTFVVTSRWENFNWTEPTFSGSRPSITNAGGSRYDFGVHGISYANLDGEGDAAVCTFRLFYSDIGCGSIDGSGANCNNIAPGVIACEEDCPSNSLLPGNQPLYLTCSMYGMWDEAVKYTDYIYPACTAIVDLTQRVTLSLTAMTSNGMCDNNIIAQYSLAVRNKFKTLNDMQTQNNKLCTNECIDVMIPAFSCDGDKIRVNINFGLISSTMQYSGESVTTEELLKIAVGDYKAFDFADTQNNETISPDIFTFAVTSLPECAVGYMVKSGACVLCGQGTFYNSTTETCERCPIGSYRSDTSNLMSNCTSCFASQTTPAEGARDQGYCIIKCLPGRYYNLQTNSNAALLPGTCNSCAVGYYQDVLGSISCKACSVELTTADQGSTGVQRCVTPESLTTTTTQAPLPDTGAATEDTGLSVGVIVAIVLGVLLGLTIIILIVCFCCCKGILPCMSKKKQVVAPTHKDGYYAKKYGDHNMQFVSYNLEDIREKKGKPMDRVPFVEPPLSDETGSVKTDISVHVPVFNEMMNGKVKRKHLYVSNGGQNLSVSLPRSSARTPRDPVMTSSPREAHAENIYENDFYAKPKQKRRRRKQQKERSSSEGRSRRQHGYEENEEVRVHVSGPMPKALAPMPKRLVSKPPDDTILRPSSALEQPRVMVEPSHYEDFLDSSPTRQARHHKSHHSSRSRDKDHVKSRKRPKSYDDSYEEQQPQHYAGDFYNDDQPAFHIKRIEVESDEDLR